MTDSAQEFVPSPRSQDCSKHAGGWGRGMSDFEYIWYGNKSEDDYPDEACDPYYHKSAKIDDFQITNDCDIAGDLTVTGTINGTTTGNKVLPFDIPHVKNEKLRIRHVIAEGPEAGIYIRGKLKDSNQIVLPEYWDGLIDPETITVTLTQIGYSQDLIVDSVDWGKIVKIRSGVGANINCYYEVWAARYINPMDHDEKLHVVYEGDSPEDYPGNNEYYLIGGWDYDRRETKWRRPDEKLDSVNLDKDA
tara:strand:- start:43 stop:786 length:744 start_codon:yes stop_codon:yes gene_type:complete